MVHVPDDLERIPQHAAVAQLRPGLGELEGVLYARQPRADSIHGLEEGHTVTVASTPPAIPPAASEMSWLTETEDGPSLTLLPMLAAL